jgi:hypothetical protein
VTQAVQQLESSKHDYRHKIDCRNHRRDVYSVGFTLSRKWTQTSNLHAPLRSNQCHCYGIFAIDLHNLDVSTSMNVYELGMLRMAQT